MTQRIAGRRRVGTVYLEVVGDQDPDWFSLGPQLATYLEVPSQRDAFALLLGATDVTRLSYLRSRGITEEALERAAVDLDLAFDESAPQPLPDDDEAAADNDPGATVSTVSDGADATAVASPAEAPISPASGEATTVARDLPPLTSAAIVIEDGPDLTVTAPAPACRDAVHRRSARRRLGPGRCGQSTDRTSR